MLRSLLLGPELAANLSNRKYIHGQKKSKQDIHEWSPANGWRHRIKAPPQEGALAGAALRSSKELGHRRETDRYPGLQMREDCSSGDDNSVWHKVSTGS